MFEKHWIKPSSELLRVCKNFSHVWSSDFNSQVTFKMDRHIVRVAEVSIAKVQFILDSYIVHVAEVYIVKLSIVLYWYTVHVVEVYTAGV
jgi:hypothetical protein